MHTHSTSVHIQCEAIYDNTGVRDVNFMLSKVQMFEVYTYSYSLAKSMLTVFHCYINSQVHLLDIFVFIYLGARNCYIYVNKKGKSVPLQAWSGPEGSRKLGFADIMTTGQDGDKVVSLMHRLHLPPGNTPGTHFLEAESTPGP